MKRYVINGFEINLESQTASVWSELEIFPGHSIDVGCVYEWYYAPADPDVGQPLPDVTISDEWMEVEGLSQIDGREVLSSIQLDGKAQSLMEFLLRDAVLEAIFRYKRDAEEYRGEWLYQQHRDEGGYL